MRHLIVGQERTRRLGLLLVAMLLLAAPGFAQTDWNQAYGNIGNTSFVVVDTNIGVTPLWSVDLGGSVAWGGPAIGAGGTIYVGTTNGFLAGYQPDSSLRCSILLRDAVITSTPAVLPRGEVAVLFNRLAVPGMQGFLALFTADCQPIWERELPRWSLDFNSVSTGSVKVWSSGPDAPFLFVNGRGTRLADVSNLQNAPHLATYDDLLVYNTNGQLVGLHPVGDICLKVEGGGSGWDLGLGNVWDFLWPSAAPVPPLFEQFGWPDSTPAIMDAEIPGHSSAMEPLVAYTGGCAAELEVLRFRPNAVNFTDRLTKTWSTSIAEEGTRLSSPAVAPDGKVVVGTSRNRLRVYDLATHSLVWEADTEQPVVHPPAMAPAVWFTISEFSGWLLDPGSGDLAPTKRPQPRGLDGTLAASAASQTQAFVPNFEGLEIWSYDLRVLTHPLQSERFRTSHPALTQGGRLYVVSQTEEGRSVLFAFGPP